MDTQDHAGSSMNDSGTGKTIDAPVTQPSSRPVRGYVYFIRAGDAIKIGYSKNTPKRLTALQVSNANDLVLLGNVRGTPDDERKLHQMFCQFWLRGEWFQADEDLIDYIKCAVTKRRKPPVCRPSPDTLAIIKGLIKARQACGGDTPLGHRYSNLIEQTRNCERAKGDQRGALIRAMARSIKEIEALR